MELIDKAALLTEIKERQKRNQLDCTPEGSGAFYEDGFIIDIINSLEVKEVEEKFERPSTKIEDSECVGSRMKYIDEDLKPVAKFILEFANWNLHKDEWNHPVLEVPLFRVLDALIQRGKPYNETCMDCETKCPNFDEAQGTSFVK
jgi:hypothetical protein